jgi:hypothetical protein
MASPEEARCISRLMHHSTMAAALKATTSTASWTTTGPSSQMVAKKQLGSLPAASACPWVAAMVGARLG